MNKEDKKNYMKAWREKNKEKLKEYNKLNNKLQYEKNKEKRLEQNKKYYTNNKAKVLDKQKEYANKNSAKKKEYKKQYRIDNKDVLREKDRQYYSNNKEKILAKNKIYRNTNKEKIQKQKNINQKERLEIDYLFKLKRNIRRAISRMFELQNIKKSKKTLEILGCTYEELKTYLESKWEPWMNWKNYGQYKTNGERTWNIDHIKPISIATNELEIIQLNHYTNLRPLCSRENLDKSNIY